MGACGCQCCLDCIGCVSFRRRVLRFWEPCEPGVQQGWCLRRAKQSAVGVACAAQEAEEEAEEFVEADEEEDEEDAEAAAAEEEEEEEIEYVDDADVDLDEVRLRGDAVALH